MGCGGSKNDDTRTEEEMIAEERAVFNNQLEIKFELNAQTLQHFIVVEREICIYEKRHICETLQVRKEQMEQLKKSLQHMEEEHMKLSKELPNEKAANGRNRDNRNVKNFVMGQGKYDEMAAYERADHLAALNRMEILCKEIDGTKHHISELMQETDILEEDMNDLEELRESKDKLLVAVFDGEYGSERENLLEEEQDKLEAQLRKIEEVNFKWRQAHVMVEYACRQIGTAVEKWEAIIKLPMTSVQINNFSSSMEPRYKLAEETRNNLIAAGQNLQGAHRYLEHIKFPYCTPEEVQMLNKATSYVFTDMQAKARQTHALDVYVAAYKRTAALLQWFNETINNWISKDLMKVKEQAKKVAIELRKERVRLIKIKVKEILGKDVDISTADLEFENESDLDVSSDDKDKKRNESGGMRGSYSDLSYSNLPNAPSPLPKEELAPPPTKLELFGKIEIIKNEHEKNMNKLNNDMRMQKAKTERNLNDKLNQRRNRRARLRDDSEQKSQLITEFDHKANIDNHHNKSNHRPRHPNEVEDVLDDMDGEIIMDKVMKKVQRY